ncbi:MAG: hypothetical protein AAF740_02120 [Bacteroidota bacterium]
MTSTFVRSSLTALLLTFTLTTYALTPASKYRYLQHETQTVELFKKADAKFIAPDSSEEEPTNWTWAVITTLLGGMYLRFVHKK